MKCRMLWVLACGVGLGALAAVGGCIGDSGLLDVTAADLAPTVAGTYWVEYADGKVTVYQMPQYRGDPGAWYEAAEDPPEWYATPGLYTLSDDGAWSQDGSGTTGSFDETLQLWDAPPLPDSTAGSN